MSTAADMVTVVDRNTIAFERRFPDKLERVWSAITVKDEIDHWFMKTELDLRVGGAFSFEKGWDGWISELENQCYVQFNSSHESFTRFEIELDVDGTLFHLIDKLPDDFVMEVGCRQDSPIEDSDTEKMRLVGYNQPGGPGTHWTGVVAGWHAFVDSLESYLTGEPSGEGHNRVSIFYDRFLIDYHSI